MQKQSNRPSGVAQAADTGRWFSLSEEAFSSGTVMFDTREEAERHDARHATFMGKNHPNARPRKPYITRA